jgi:hypothetical protein
VTVLTKGREDWEISDIYCCRGGNHNEHFKLEKRLEEEVPHRGWRPLSNRQNCEVEKEDLNDEK